MKTNTLTQITVELRHLKNQLQEALPASLQKPLKRLAHRVESSKGWLIGGAGLLLWLWMWQWMLAIGAGLAVTVGVYLIQQRRLKLSWRGWQRLWSRANRSLSLSVLAGVVALGSTYLATAVWLETDQHWLVTSILLEGLGILAIVSVLLWQLLHRQLQQQDQTGDRFQQWLSDLSHPDPLRRLIAIRQTTRLLLAASTSNSPLPMTSTHLADCFRLMLDRETETVVCSALIESLQALNPVRQLEGTQLSTVAMRSATKTKVSQQFSTEES